MRSYKYDCLKSLVLLVSLLFNTVEVPMEIKQFEQGVKKQGD